MSANFVPGQAGHKWENGCYVDGHRGIYGYRHLIEVFGTEMERKQIEGLSESIESDFETIIDRAERIENRLNQSELPEGQFAHWDDGEFFISPVAGNLVLSTEEVHDNG